MNTKSLILKAYADRQRAEGNADAYNASRSKIRKFHKSPQFIEFRKATKEDKFIPISVLLSV